MEIKPTMEADFKITKGELDATLAAGFKYAQFTNNGVNKRAQKVDKKLARQQEVLANRERKKNKQFDEFLKQQNINIVDKKLASFEAEVAELSVQATESIPVVETFPVPAEVLSQEFADSL